MLIYQISSPKQQDTKTFITFMREEYFPAVHKGLLRIGQVTDLVLFQGNVTDITHEFVWHVSGLLNDPRISDEEVLRRFDSFGARVKFIGDYSEVAAWHSGECGQEI